MNVLLASTNKHKLAELQAIGIAFGIRIVSPRSLVDEGTHPAPPEVDETAPTYAGNAELKAEAYRAWSGMATLADDSGLEVMALGGRPGVKSARYLGPEATDRDRYLGVLGELESLERESAAVDRSAYFVSSLVLITASGQRLSQEYRAPGRILRQPQGKNGFGYDPIMFIDDVGQTLAELPFEETCRTGFRARAAQALFGRFTDPLDSLESPM